MESRALCVALVGLAIGCNEDRPLAFVPVDAAAAIEKKDLTAGSSDGNSAADLSMPDLAVAAPRPCTLVAAGEPVQTVSYENPASSWHCEGLLARSGVRNHVIHYGDVSLRFGGWDDPAIVATELDVSTWPPTTIVPATQLFFSMHSPASLFELSADTLGMTWSFDNDGLGPEGVEFQTVNAASWTATPNALISGYMGVQGTPVALAGGKQFAITLHTAYQDPSANMLLAIVGSDGQVVQSSVLAHAGSSSTLALERTKTDLLAAAAYPTCSKDDPAFCQAGSLVILRASGGTSAQSPLVLDKVAAIPARNPALTISQPVLLSDRDRANFLAWWEVGDHESYLFAVPLSSGGQPAGPVEVWFTTTSAAMQWRASIGSTGVVIPVAMTLSTDSGEGFREVHLIQRQLTVDAPVGEIVFRTMYTSFAVGTAQLDEPRSLIVGYSDYPQISGTSGFGVLAKYVCAED